jgi:IS605 OrfB family transposase
MQKRKFTVVIQLHEKNNQDIITYVESSRSEYAKAVRETFYTIKNSDSFNESSFNTYLQSSYGITRRTAKSIISDAQGRFNSLKELKQYEAKQLERKISHLEERVIPKLVKKMDDNSKLLQARISVSLIKQRNLRLKIVAKKNKLNRLKQKLVNLNYQLESGRLKLCFGTKKLLEQDYDKFVEQRDSQMTFIGAKEETCCNHNFQLRYNRKDNQFSIKMRRDFGGYKSVNIKDKFIYGKVYFNHHKNKIISILKDKNSPLSYKIIKKNDRYYICCTFEIQIDTNSFITCSDYGTIGLDFNKGFVTLSETNQYGHLVQTRFLPYRFRAGNKTKTDLQEIANHVMTLASQTGKSICIENLDFKVAKSKTETKQGKQYNDMTHSLAYHQFVETMESIAYRNKVTLIKVNPAWTSWLAKKLFCPTMKLNVHVGASYVIARRGQGYKDTVKSL